MELEWGTSGKEPSKIPITTGQGPHSCGELGEQPSVSPLEGRQVLIIKGGDCLGFLCLAPWLQDQSCDRMEGLDGPSAQESRYGGQLTGWNSSSSPPMYMRG